MLYYAKDEAKPSPKDVYQILRFFLSIPASAADATAVNPNGVKTLSANSLITFFININPVFHNGPRSLPRNSLDCIILDNWVSEYLILVDNNLPGLYEDLQLVY